MVKKQLLYSLLLKLGLHIIFWIGILFFYVYFFGYNSTNISYVFTFSCFLMPVTMGTTYTVNYYLIPGYLLPKKYKLFILYSIYTLILSCFIIVLSIFYGLIFLSDLSLEEMPPMSRNIPSILIVVYLVVILVSAFKLLKHNYSSISENKELKNKLLEGQLKLKEQELYYLKMQIHPHFLFNTLNTLYGFALKKAEDTPDMILKLSNLLDYLLYQADKPMVSLEEEIEHIKDYIALEKMRFQNTLCTDFKINGSITHLEIAPMLLIPFVENSFKHGSIIDGKLHITMQLKIKDSTLAFVIENSVKGYEKQNISPEGIGLKNIRKRLELAYPNRHTLKIENSECSFKVSLFINLINNKND
ncbi:histidine kinase [Flavobacteriaceae bacterium R38]|nr:histidine kinase [Flavobacteriaceae bacterium R38]